MDAPGQVRVPNVVFGAAYVPVSNGHWRRKRARAKYTRIPAVMAASEANMGVRPVEMKMAIQPTIAIRTGTG